MDIVSGMFDCLLELPVLSIKVGHAGLCPQFVRVRADSLAFQRGKSIDNHNTESSRSVTSLNIFEEKRIDQNFKNITVNS